MFLLLVGHFKQEKKKVIAFENKVQSLHNCYCPCLKESY